MQLQQDVQAKYPEFLSAVVDKIVPSLTQLAAEEDRCQRLFTNLIHLCRWSSVPDTQQSARYQNLVFLCTELSYLLFFALILLMHVSYLHIPTQSLM